MNELKNEFKMKDEKLKIKIKMSELNYINIYQYTRNLSKEYEKNKCDPRSYHISYCKDFKLNIGSVLCPKTCEYAANLERKASEGFE